MEPPTFLQHQKPSSLFSGLAYKLLKQLLIPINMPPGNVIAIVETDKELTTNADQIRKYWLPDKVMTRVQLMNTIGHLLLGCF